MPVPRPSVTFFCTHCRWRKTVVFDSDVMFSGYNSFEVCPECTKAVQSRPATMIEIGISRLAGAFVR